VKWEPYNGATSYAVYIKGGDYSTYTRLDNMLVRDYGSYGRADMVGLKAGTDYAFKVVPIINGTEDQTKASMASSIKVVNYIRQGFAHKGYSGVGAYNDDGSLVDRSKPGAVITDEDIAIERVIEIVKNGTVSSITGKKITVKADSICLHGDGIKAVEFAKKINAALNSEGISILPIGTVIKEA
jgi:hypothetical protein